MASQTGICNYALSRLGVENISSIDDGSDQAKTLKAFYDITLAAELRKHDWSFAKRRASLAALAETPTYGFERYFAFPDKCIRLLAVSEYYVGYPLLGANYVNSDPTPYYIEGRKIATNLKAPLKITYIYEETDTTQFDALFTQAFGLALAAASAEQLTGSNGALQALMQEYMMVIQQAKKVNSIEHPAMILRDGSGLLSRVGP